MAVQVGVEEAHAEVDAGERGANFAGEALRVLDADE